MKEDNEIIIIIIGIMLLIIFLAVLGLRPYMMTESLITHAPPYKNYWDYCYNTLGYTGGNAISRCVKSCEIFGCDLGG